MGVTVILLIAILFRFKLEHVATLASITALIIMGTHTGNFYISAFYRFVLVMVGVISSSAVNLLFLPLNSSLKFIIILKHLFRYLCMVQTCIK